MTFRRFLKEALLFILPAIGLVVSGCGGSAQKKDNTLGGPILAVGEADPTFAETGVALNNFDQSPFSRVSGRVVLNAPGGKYVVVASLNNTSLVAYRFNSDGSLDTTFGADAHPADGKLDGFIMFDLTGLGIQNQSPHRAAFDSSGRITIAGDVNLGMGEQMAVWRLLGTGQMDTTFGGDAFPADGTPDGFAIFTSPAGGNIYAYGRGLAIDSVGRILVAGSGSSPEPGWDMVLWRLTSSGTLDPTFGGDVNPADGQPDGFFFHHNAGGGNSQDHARDVVTDASGNILVSGYSFAGLSDLAVVLWRLTPTGLLDTTFNGKGWVSYNYGTGYDIASDMALTENGDILITGFVTNSDYDMVVYRFKPNGLLDPNFGEDLYPVDGTPDGFIIRSNGGQENDQKLIFDPFGNIVLSQNLGASAFQVYRFTPDGQGDPEFGQDLYPADGIPDGFIQITETGGAGGGDQGFANTVDPLGRILVTGESLDMTNLWFDLGLWRFR
ncbi:MAG: hypothetical protein OEZ59_10160 [Deltaproteobacteria bacterium]|nr:hypothetical protein [Deltaproteobacteria bacterium]